MLSLVLPFAITVAHADDSASQLLQDANDAGQDDVNTSTDEDANDAASQVFDTPSQTPLDTTTSSEGSNGFGNAPTYNSNGDGSLSDGPKP